MQWLAELIVKVLVSALLGVAVGAVRQWWAAQKAGQYKAQLVLIEGIVAKAVSAAEQLGLTGELAEFADKKLDYAMDYAAAILAGQYGIQLDADSLRLMIEAEVRDSLGWEKHERAMREDDAVSQARLNSVTVSNPNAAG